MTTMVGERAGDAHERLVEGIVRDFFGALDTSDSAEEGGMGSQRDAVEGDLKSLTWEELYFALTDTGRFLESVYDIAEQTNWVATAVISDAHNRTRASLKICRSADAPYNRNTVHWKTPLCGGWASPPSRGHSAA